MAGYRFFCFSVAIAALSMPSVSAQSIGDALTGGKTIFDARLRYENVDQTGLPYNATALTARARFGYETAAYEGLKFLVEAEATLALEPDRYNDSYNGLTKYPVVADPEQLELNRAQLSYTGIKDIGVVIGRQRLILDNARYIGNAGFRQNEQTFDAALVTYTGIPKAKLTYAYIDDVRRVFGHGSPVGRFRSDSHVFNATYQVMPPLKLTGYAYLLDLKNKNGTVTTVSTQTFGGRADGKYKLDQVELSYAAEYASQKNYGNNPRRFKLDYYLGEAGVAAKGFSLTGGYEVLQGNGVQGFATPLATLFAFNGWADVFLNTPGAGVKDLYAKAGYTRDKVPYFGTVKAQVHYHDYKRDFGSGSYGNEWDALLSASPNKYWTVEARLAKYDGKTGPFADRTKIWISINYVK
jgi:hypothetical protein